MKQIQSRYGMIYGTGAEEYYPSGRLKSVIAERECILHTSCGDVPLNYTAEEPRKKYRPSAEFYEDGSLESVYLEEPVYVESSIGRVKAELITFYETGAVDRLFPLYGQVNAYWSEEDEYRFAEEIRVGYKRTVESEQEEVSCKPLCLAFYPDGQLKSVTIWKYHPVMITTPYGVIATNFGFDLYESGVLKSIEPDYKTLLQTENGKVRPFRLEHNLFHAEDNAVKFTEKGELLPLTEYKRLS